MQSDNKRPYLNQLLARWGSVRHGLTGLLIGIFVIWAAGCTPAAVDPCVDIRMQEERLRQLLDEFIEDEMVTSEQLDALTLMETPVELQIVLDDEETYTIEDHPLAEVVPGESRDSADFLQGCWGRVDTERMYGNPGVTEVVAEAMRIDLRDGAESWETETLRGLEGRDCLVDDRPLMQRFLATVIAVDDSSARIRKTVVQAAGQNATGTLTLHEAGLAELAAEATEELDIYYTVDGDFLITSSLGFDPDDPDLDDTDLWIRFDCTR